MFCGAANRDSLSQQKEELEARLKPSAATHDNSTSDGDTVNHGKPQEVFKEVHTVQKDGAGQVCMLQVKIAPSYSLDKL
jgi:hypothetical protein